MSRCYRKTFHAKNRGFHRNKPCKYCHANFMMEWARKNHEKHHKERGENNDV